MTAGSNPRLTDPVHGEEVPKVDDAVAVGEDLAFQERWWTFERIIWSVFVLILLADMLGVFGAGWLAHASIAGPGLGMHVRYDRVARTGTPNTLAVEFAADAAQHGKLQLLVSDSVVKTLGAQRVIPEPQTSAITTGGILYTLPEGSTPGEVDFELEPSTPGMYHFTLQVPGHPAVSRRVLVMP